MNTDDLPEREFDGYESEESISNFSESEAISNPLNAMENPNPSRKPRREVWWVDLGATNHSLKSIGQRFEDRLNWSLLSSSNPLLRQVRSPKDIHLRQDLHRCPGYLREEITLTCDLSKSAIVSHAFPGPSERCSICHQLVQYTYSESIDLDSVYASEMGLPPSLEDHQYETEQDETEQEKPQPQEKPQDIAETLNPTAFPVSLVADLADVPVEEEHVKMDGPPAVARFGISTPASRSGTPGPEVEGKRKRINPQTFQRLGRRISFSTRRQGSLSSILPGFKRSESLTWSF